LALGSPAASHEFTVFGFGTAIISACGTSPLMNAARPDHDGRSLTRATRISWDSPARTTSIGIDPPIG